MMLGAWLEAGSLWTGLDTPRMDATWELEGEVTTVTLHPQESPSI